MGRRGGVDESWEVREDGEDREEERRTDEATGQAKETRRTSLNRCSGSGAVARDESWRKRNEAIKTVRKEPGGQSDLRGDADEDSANCLLSPLTEVAVSLRAARRLQLLPD